MEDSLDELEKGTERVPKNKVLKNCVISPSGKSAKDCNCCWICGMKDHYTDKCLDKKWKRLVSDCQKSIRKIVPLNINLFGNTRLVQTTNLFMN